MSEPGYVYVDMNGPMHGPQEPEPAWKRCWRGQELLWKAFWGWFFFGHGIILGCSVGVMVLAMVLGFATNPGSLNSGFAGLATGLVLLVLVTVPYGIWSGVSVWRCAKNCLNKKWGYGARIIILIYAIGIAAPILNLII